MSLLLQEKELREEFKMKQALQSYYELLTIFFESLLLGRGGVQGQGKGCC